MCCFAVFSSFVNMNFLRGTNALLSICNKTNPLRLALYTQGADSVKKYDDLVKGKKIVVFMKGTPDAPRCGFSNAVVQILRFHGVDNFDSHDVLSDEDLRQGIKEYSNWPTIPQVYFNGDFLGGCDIMLDMHKSGDLIEELNKIGIRSALLDKPKEDG